MRAMGSSPDCNLCPDKRYGTPHRSGRTDTTSRPDQVTGPAVGALEVDHKVLHNLIPNKVDPIRHVKLTFVEVRTPE